MPFNTELLSQLYEQPKQKSPVSNIMQSLLNNGQQAGQQQPWYKTKGGIAGISGLTSSILSGLLGANVPEALAYGTIGASKGLDTSVRNQRIAEEEKRRDETVKAREQMLNLQVENTKQKQMQDIMARDETRKKNAINSVQNAIKSGIIDANIGNEYLKNLGYDSMQFQNPKMIDNQAKLQALNLGNKKVMVNPYTGETVSSFDISQQQKAGITPSSVAEYEYYLTLSPDEKNQYLAVKRNPTIMNLGGEHVVYNPSQGGIQESFPVTPKPEQMPEFKEQQAYSTQIGKQQAETQESLLSQTSKLPNLEKTVEELSELGKKATYTKTGQFKDTISRQLGFEPSEGAIARAEYIAKVDNQILPLLRDTFGAQFTEREGQTLKETLGSIDNTPAEKEAALKSFIEQKKRNISDLERQLSPEQNRTNTEQTPSTVGRFKIRIKQ